MKKEKKIEMNSIKKQQYVQLQEAIKGPSTFRTPDKL